MLLLCILFIRKSFQDLFSSMVHTYKLYANLIANKYAHRENIQSIKRIEQNAVAAKMKLHDV